MPVQQGILSQEQVASFAENGYLLVPDFYDVEKEIRPIQQGIYNIIGLLIEKHRLPITRPPFSSETFDAGIMEMIAIDRKFGALVYDAAKQIPAFIRLLASEKHEALVRQIRQTDTPGMIPNGYGVRIDFPFEEKFRSPWHQEYLAWFKSLDGLIFWSPLLAVTPELGPMKLCPGSHKNGIFPVYSRDVHHPEKNSGYAMVIQDEEKQLNRYDCIAPLTQPGDLIINDFLVLHASGQNVGDRPRWSFQVRYFNFEDPVGLKNNWCGSVHDGIRVQDVHPEYILEV